MWLDHRNFVGEKPVTDLAGVEEVLGNRLKAAGYDKAYTVLGQYLVLKKDLELFYDKMKNTCNANVKQATDSHQWCDEFL